MTDSTETFLAFSEKLADSSRALLLAAAADVPRVDLKQDASFVTATDRAVETRLREQIRAAFPDHGIMGEEYGSEQLGAEFVWVLDPIDGTAAWVAGIPVYGTLISLARGGKPLLGVIDLPATTERLTGISGRGAWHNGKPIRCRKGTALSDAYMTSSNPRFVPEADQAPFARLDDAVQFTQYGGSCYSYACLARGRTDLAVDAGFDAYDLFAPTAIIEGAGGIVTDWQGHPLDLAWQGRVIAAGDQALHAAALERLGSRTSG
ncbi:inositol monophosphatase family protein [Sinorhizobium sp. RAC02]|uniref:inositol monophosphatase family protein n=1 Tax=Sinorhizobium sp. RAC02 TaxID=1842534 RepID=UPI00083D2CEB|nr:inositol monophosphatase family protein [Sinorhizobium sp. RAC02]AOF94313.1 inositol monophosphatase family protein [Sinorhizobium sp. RAC02]